jgi:hypothetical protein
MLREPGGRLIMAKTGKNGGGKEAGLTAYTRRKV